MLHILNITRPQFILSNILQVQINMIYLFTPSPPQQYKPSDISHIIIISRHAQNQQRLPHQNSTNSRTSVMPAGVVNLVVQSKKAILLNCSNSALSLVFSSADLEDQLNGNPSVKTKQPSVPVKLKSWPPTSAPQNYNTWSIVPTTLAFHTHMLGPKYTTTTRQPFNGQLQWPQKASST